ncbi:zinc ribbon domain-containing protein [Acerihabitans sp. TG2]|uniref:zinc ribbon domain-containing protein n=1 Tax=Acerihabitans sp. TG2 TaxID=3096008 RepID=UPI002B228397|nr:zinc ribbon domain-containing protein [Acerihabitans sp. TG2]MEA9392474.1 zinc ribbon domain-containing protein [Acerihabitans sp. TG2]
MEMRCPVCQSPLQSHDDHVYCDHCQRRYQQLALCPDCSKPLDVLKACGAVDYFCSHGDGLISKRRVNLLYAPL